MDVDRWSISRGFGFITFKDANSVDNVLATEVHMLDEKQVTTRRLPRDARDR